MKKIKRIALAAAAAFVLAVPAMAQDSGSTAVMRRGGKSSRQQQTTTPGVTTRMQQRLQTDPASDADLSWMKVIYRSLDLTGIAHRSISDAFAGVPLGLEQIQLSDFKSDSLTLGDVVRAHSGPAIYCARISATGCHPCIAETMRRISEYKSSHPESTVVVFVANTPNRDLNVFGAQYGRKFEFFRADTFPLDFDDEITPYVFALDTCGTIGNHEIISVR